MPQLTRDLLNHKDGSTHGIPVLLIHKCKYCYLVSYVATDGQKFNHDEREIDYTTSTNNHVIRNPRICYGPKQDTTGEIQVRSVSKFRMLPFHTCVSQWNSC